MQNPLYMLQTCQAACAACSRCCDTASGCAALVAQGEVRPPAPGPAACATGAQRAAACFSSHAPEPASSNQQHQARPPIFHTHSPSPCCCLQCARNPASMLDKCPRSCGLACPESQDALPLCSLWAGSGDCKKASGHVGWVGWAARILRPLPRLLAASIVAQRSARHLAQGLTSRLVQAGPARHRPPPRLPRRCAERRIHGQALQRRLHLRRQPVNSWN
jgi:hypothetical protein